MKTMRQDAWSAEDDAKLAEIVLRHIREGSTQLTAFQEGADLLNRTPAACGYRWNACVRKQFLAAIDVAKLERKEHRERTYRSELQAELLQTDQPPPALTWNLVFRFLRQARQDWQALQARVKQLERDMDTGRGEIEKLRRDKVELLQQLRQLSEEHMMMSEDYRALLDIVERARRRHQTEANAAEERSATVKDADAMGGSSSHKD